tara:strand:- start:413 stop:832 length:420 start_codon:yes stop_codon:yes gene_type:complete
MITFNYENDFSLDNERLFSDWISRIITSEENEVGEINYIFCDDDYLLKLNIEHLDHDTLTDVISFDYSINTLIQGDVFISVERVIENAVTFNVSFDNELKRVMAHGVLHYCGYKDKGDNDIIIMRQKEEEKIALFHVEQ